MHKCSSRLAKIRLSPRTLQPSASVMQGELLTSNNKGASSRFIELCKMFSAFSTQVLIIKDLLASFGKKARKCRARSSGGKPEAPLRERGMYGRNDYKSRTVAEGNQWKPRWQTTQHPS